MSITESDKQRFLEDQMAEDAIKDAENEIKRLRAWLGRISSVAFKLNDEAAARVLKEMARCALAGEPEDAAVTTTNARLL